MMLGYGWAGPGGWLWMLGGLLLMVGLIVLVIWAAATVARSGRPTDGDPSRPTAQEILRERFARGEISEQEFEQAKKVLGPDR